MSPFSLPSANHPQSPRQAEVPRLGQGAAVLVRRVQALVPVSRHPAALRGRRQAWQHRAHRTLHPLDEKGRASARAPTAWLQGLQAGTRPLRGMVQRTPSALGPRQRDAEREVLRKTTGQPHAAMGTPREMAARIAVRETANPRQRQAWRAAQTCRHVRRRASASASRRPAPRSLNPPAWCASPMAAPRVRAAVALRGAFGFEGPSDRASCARKPPQSRASTTVQKAARPEQHPNPKSVDAFTPIGSFRFFVRRARQEGNRIGTLLHASRAA